MQLHRITFLFKSLLPSKVCYLILFLCVVACKNNTEKESAKKSDIISQEKEPENQNGTILFFGDSITAGYGLDDTADAFPALIQDRIDSLNLKYTVVNSGVSGETTAGGNARINWILQQDIDVFILELGANDGLRGVTLSETKANLQKIVNAVKQKDPDIEIILAGMQLPPNLGKEYTTEFASIYPDLAQKNDVELIPFILDGVGGVPELNQQDGIHPTVVGHQIVANNVWEVLKDVIK